MNLFNFGRSPADWVPSGGRPARCLDRDNPTLSGMPSYERDDGIVVFDMLIVRMCNEKAFMCSSWYPTVAAIAPDGLVPLRGRSHGLRNIMAFPGLVKLLDVGAPRTWRPCLWVKGNDGWISVGSQSELAWRHTLRIAMSQDSGALEGYKEANRRARVLLQENLTAFQRLELAASGRFRCRGAATGNMYRIDVGDGFAIVDKGTCAETVSYCFHPEYWMPDEDIALSTKLVLEDPELELDCLETAKIGHIYKVPRPSRRDLYARDIERDLIV